MGCQAFSHCLELLLWGSGGRGLGSPEVSHTWARLHPRAAAEEALTLIMITCSLLWLGSNRSNDLPGTHTGQGTSFPEAGGDPIPGSQEEESFLIYTVKLMKTLLEVPALYNPRGGGGGTEPWESK